MKCFNFPEWMGESPRVSCSWNPAEEQILIADFRAGATLEQQCAKHGRAPGGINSRLEQLLDGESHRRRGITQGERDQLLGEVKVMRSRFTMLRDELHHAQRGDDQRLNKFSGELAQLTSKIYDLAK